MEKTFQTGSFSFRLRFPEELVLPADMEKFAVEKAQNKLHLPGQRNRRQRGLVNPSQHDCVRRADESQHKVLNRNREDEEL